MTAKSIEGTHLNLPKRIHASYIELHGIAVSLPDPFPSFRNMCITYPSMKQIGLMDWVLNLDGLCNCGKSYKEHKEWKEEQIRQQQIICT